MSDCNDLAYRADRPITEIEGVCLIPPVSVTAPSYPVPDPPSTSIVQPTTTTTTEATTTTLEALPETGGTITGPATLALLLILAGCLVLAWARQHYA